MFKKKQKEQPFNPKLTALTAVLLYEPFKGEKNGCKWKKKKKDRQKSRMK